MAMGADWDRAGLTPEQWITEKSEEPRFAALDFAAVFVDAADYLSSARCTTKYTSPSLFLLYQLKAAAKRCDGSAPQNQPDSLRGAA